jgi:4-hydroxymandelate oxidase
MIELETVEEMARGRLDPVAFDYVAGGAEEELTVADNVAAWHRRRFRPHVLRDVSSVTTATSVLGTAVSSPVLVAPTAMHALFCADAERATVRATAAEGTVFTLSLSSTTSLEDIAAIAPLAPRWMHIYMLRDRGRTRDLCQRIAAAGYGAIVLSVDSPVVSRRPRNERNGFNVPAGLTLPNLSPHVDPPGVDVDPDIYGLVSNFDPSVTFDDLASISEWAGGLPVVVKGVVRGDDAVRCVEAGAAAVSVSNHGGRQLDGCIATADALAEVVDAVAGRAEVYVDGGIRRGSHVLMALALGARAVMVGRSVVYGLAADGEAGVGEVLRTFVVELRRAMALCGVSDVHDVPRDIVFDPLLRSRL